MCENPGGGGGGAGHIVDQPVGFQDCTSTCVIVMFRCIGLLYVHTILFRPTKETPHIDITGYKRLNFILLHERIVHNTQNETHVILSSTNKIVRLKILFNFFLLIRKIYSSPYCTANCNTVRPRLSEQLGTY